MTRSLLTLVALVLLCTPAWAGPRVRVISADQPTPHEAALELLTVQLQQLFEATVVTSGDNTDATIVLGRPERGAAKLAKAIGDRWPKLSEQGHVVRTLSEQPPVLLLGGGSDLATYWAVCEFGQRHGVRYLPLRDVYPIDKPAWKPTGHDHLLEPRVAERAFSAFTPSPVGTAYWGADDWNTLLTQLSKLKFNRMATRVAPQPTVSLFGSGTQPLKILLERDAPGRRAFRDVLVFGNPQLTTSTAAAAEAEFINSIFTRAQAVGIQPLDSARTTTGTTLALHEPALGVFPQSHLHHLFDASAGEAFASPATVSWASPDEGMIGLSLASRVFWTKEATTATLCHYLFTPMAGRDDVAERMQLGLDLLEKTNDKLAKLLTDNKLSCEPGPNMLLQFLTVENDLEPAWKEILDGFVKSNNEFLRAHGNAPGPIRLSFFYFTKRGELSIHLTNCHIALAAAAKARKAKDSYAEVEQLEKALESLYMGINSLSEVTQHQSDRGVIAALNEFGYKPLNKEIERLSQ